MSASHQHPIDPESRDYTDKDVQIKPLMTFFVGTAITVGAVFCILYAIWKDLDARDADRENALPAMAVERQLPPDGQPRLQARPLVELAVHQAYEKSLVDNGVSWADAGKTKARIPVTNAMEILAARNAFPVRAAK